MDETVYIALVFRVDEPVTPEHLARRVAEACGKYYALRPGEAVILPDGSGRELRIAELPEPPEPPMWPPTD